MHICLHVRVCARARACLYTFARTQEEVCFQELYPTNLFFFFSLHFFFYGSYLRPPPNQGNSNAQIFAEAEINVRGRKNGVGQLRTEMLVSIRYL